MTPSQEYFERAQKVIPGGVNSPVRAFRSVGTHPRYIRSADMQYITDVEGNIYIDYIGSWGPMILGHNHPEIRKATVEAVQRGLSFGASCPAEVEIAELICSTIPSIDMVRMVNSGTEAVMSALRVARGYTKRDKIIKFAGCYHGHFDALLVKAGSGLMTSGIPDSAGVPKGTAQDTLTATYNDLGSVEALFAQYPDEIAAVIVEPVAANMGVVTPADGFLQGLRDICTRSGALLIFDEVITGFRMGMTGAQGYYGVEPDLTTFGKIIGAGMPVGAYGGRRDVMKMVAPVGPVYQAGTLSGNPVAMAAGLTQLKILQAHPEYYEKMFAMGDDFRAELRGILQRTGKPYRVNGVGTLTCLYFTEQDVVNYDTACTADTDAFRRYFLHMLGQGIYLAPSQFEAMFFCNAHTQADVDRTLQAAEDYFRQ